MKYVRKKVVVDIPEALTKSLTTQSTSEERHAVWQAIVEWSGVNREQLEREHDASLDVPAWLQLAVFLAIKTLPCFSQDRKKNKGGRSRLDVVDGLLGLSNPHAELIQLVLKEQQAAKIRGDSTAILETCSRLTRKKLPKRYHNLTATRLKRLYHEGNKFDREHGRAKPSLATTLARSSSRQ